MASNQGGTQLFLLRLWLEQAPQEGGEKDGPDQEKALNWHGKVQHLIRGEAHAFTGWDTLIACIESMLWRDQVAPAQAMTEPQTPEAAANKNNSGETK